MAATAGRVRGLTDDDACVVAALDAADRAWRRAPGAEADLVVSGVRIRLRLAGPRTALALLPPLSRITTEAPGEPDVVVTAFDSVDGDEPPRLPEGAHERRRGSRSHLMVEPDVPLLTALEPATGRGVYWAGDASALPIWHAASPLRDLLRWALRARGLHYVHGAVVGDHRGGVLLAGRSGSGKSTSAFVCAARGLRHLTDDYCVVTLDDPPVAHALFSTAKLDGGAIARLGLDARAPAGSKAVVDAGTVGTTVDRLPLRSLVLPRVGERTGELEPVSPAVALAGLAPSTLIQLPGSSAGDLAAMATMVRAMRTYRLVVGPDVDTVATRIREALA